MAKSLTYPARGQERFGELAVIPERRPLPLVLSTRYGARDFLTLLFKEKRLILVTFLGTLLLAIAASFVPSVKYTASSRLLVLLSREYTFRPQIGSEGASGAMLALDNAHIIRSEVEILGNPELKREVVRRFGPERIYPGLDKELRTEKDRRQQIDAAVKNLAANMKIDPVRDSNVVRVSFAHPDPYLAADLLNTIVQIYLDHRRELYGQRGSAFVTSQRENFATRLAEAEKAMEAFKLKNDITVIDEQKLLLLRNQAELETARRDTASRLREATARLDNLNGSLGKVARTVPLYSESTSTPAIETAKARLLELELRRNELMAKYSPNSRFVTDVNNQIALVRQFLAQETRQGPSTQRVGANPTYEGLQAEAIRLRAEVDSLRARQTTLDGQVAALEDRRARLEQLEREYRELALNRQILEQQYQAYAAKAEEARIMEDLDSRQAANIRIVERAVPPTEGRNLQPLIIALGLVAALMTALAAALFREFTRTTLVTPEAAERSLGLPVLVAVPLKAGSAPPPRPAPARASPGPTPAAKRPFFARRRTGRSLGSALRG